MYSDRRHVKNRIIPVRLDEAGESKLERMARLRHMQPAALARELLMQSLDEAEKLARQLLLEGLDNAERDGEGKTMHTTPLKSAC